MVFLFLKSENDSTITYICHSLTNSVVQFKNMKNIKNGLCLQKENKMLLESTNSVLLFDQLSYKCYKIENKNTNSTNLMINTISTTLG